MALTRTLSTPIDFTAQTTLSGNYTVVSGTELLIMRVFARGVTAKTSISSASFAGNAISQITNGFVQDTGNQGVCIAVYAIDSPAAGSTAYSVSLGVSSNARISFEYWSSSTSAPQVKGNTASTNFQASTTSVSTNTPYTTASGEYGSWLVASNNSRTWTEGANISVDFENIASGATNTIKSGSYYSTNSGRTSYTATLDSAAAVVSLAYIVNEVEVVSTFTPISYFFS